MKVLGVKDIDEIVPGISRHVEGKVPKITTGEIFDGSLSHGLKNLSPGKKVLQAEVTGFLCNWYPDKASEIICDILEILESDG